MLSLVVSHLIQKSFYAFLPATCFPDAVIIFETAFSNFAFIDRFADGATRVRVMFAIPVFALAQIVMEFDKTVEDLFRFKMPEAKFANAGESITSPPCGK